MKRTDPFKFGSRFLEEGDNVFEFNAWDHVMPDQSYFDFAEKQYAAQRENPVNEFDKARFNSEPEKWWNKFYSNNTSNFFKNRKWLQQEFPILSRLTSKDAGEARILEIGAGAGNTAFPILSANENDDLFLFAYDFSKKAVDLIKANSDYDASKISAENWDVAGDSVPPGIDDESIDVVLMVFIFSALSPQQWRSAVMNIWRVLKPGGEVCFRDYARGDLTQVRFKKGRLLDDNFYIRGDGTRVYFFEEEQVRAIWTQPWNKECSNVKGEFPSDQKSETEHSPMQVDSPASLFDVVDLGVDRRMLVNRQKQLKMYRCWLQGSFRKNCTTAG